MQLPNVNRTEHDNLKGIDKNKYARMIAKRTGIVKKDCLKMIEAMIDVLKDDMKSGHGVHIPRLGKFDYYVRGPKISRDPETGEFSDVPPVTRIRYVPCVDVKYGVRELDLELYLSDYQRNESQWYKDLLAEREANENNDSND